jgi:hypothetical protein
MREQSRAISPSIFNEATMTFPQLGGTAVIGAPPRRFDSPAAKAANSDSPWSAVQPRRQKNAAYRTREHLEGHEVERLIEAAKRNRHGDRDGLMILLAYRHGRTAKLLR